MGAWIAIGLLIAALLGLFLWPEAGTIAGMEQDDFARLAAGLALIIFLGGAVFASYRGRIKDAVKHAVGWAAFFLVLIGLYAYRGELSGVAERVAGELMPPGAPVTINNGPEGRSVRVRRHWNGHFIAKAQVNGKVVSMIVDTGASTVVLRPEDAKSAGINTARLNYTVPIQTANGRAFAARVRLDRVMIGPVALGDVEALIAMPGSLHQSLLGMSFLNRLRSYEFSGDFLILRS